MKKSVILSVVIILILIIAGLFLLIQNKNIDIQNDNGATRSEPVVEERQDIPAGWKEYIINEYKFSILYPEEYDFGFGSGNIDVSKYNDQDELIVSFMAPVDNDMASFTSISIKNANGIEIMDQIINDAKKSSEYYRSRIKYEVEKITDAQMKELMNKQPDIGDDIIKYMTIRKEKYSINLTQYITEHIHNKKFNDLDVYIIEIESGFTNYYFIRDGKIFTIYSDSHKNTIIEQMIHSFKFHE